MILGVDHIALSCGDIYQGAQLLNESGYRIKFLQTNVPNHPAKQLFLKSYDSMHSLAYCQITNGVSIELTQHFSPLSDTASFYQVLMGVLPSNSIPFDRDMPPSWGNAWRIILGCRNPAAFLWRPLHTQFWYDEHINKHLNRFIRAVLVSVINLAISERFWVAGLGFHIVNSGITEDGRKWALIAFRAPVQAWSLEVILLEDDSKTHPYVDDPGFPCLALISNSLIKDKEFILTMGARNISEEFSLEVGEKKVKIIMLSGPDNELLEIIEFCR